LDSTAFQGGSIQRTFAPARCGRTARAACPPGVELERRLDQRAVVVHERSFGVHADGLHVDELGLQPRLGGQILEEADRLAVLDRVGVGREVDEAAAREQRPEALAQLVEQAVELVGPGGQDAEASWSSSQSH
jgi:hypothetical protein